MEKKQCKICGRTNPKTKVTYNLVQEALLCLDCYGGQFTRTPMHPRPIFLGTFTLSR